MNVFSQKFRLLLVYVEKIALLCSFIVCFRVPFLVLFDSSSSSASLQLPMFYQLLQHLATNTASTRSAGSKSLSQDTSGSNGPMLRGCEDNEVLTAKRSFFGKSIVFPVGKNDLPGIYACLFHTCPCMCQFTGEISTFISDIGKQIHRTSGGLTRVLTSMTPQSERLFPPGPGGLRPGRSFRKKTWLQLIQTVIAQL